MLAMEVEGMHARRLPRGSQAVLGRLALDRSKNVRVIRTCTRSGAVERKEGAHRIALALRGGGSGSPLLKIPLRHLSIGVERAYVGPSASGSLGLVSGRLWCDAH